MLTPQSPASQQELLLVCEMLLMPGTQDAPLHQGGWAATESLASPYSTDAQTDQSDKCQEGPQAGLGGIWASGSAGLGGAWGAGWLTYPPHLACVLGEHSPPSLLK
jgi:hypothetical protein